MPGIRSGQVVVITGASTGIGRATALEFARQGARLVIAARQIAKLQDVADECHELGGECVALSVDVTDAKEVQDLADEALRRWGRIDVWINNAGIGVIGSFTDVPLEEHRRVIETNLMGYVHGAYSALKVFKAQGRGTLINNGSVCSRVATPNLAAYTASKFAIRGLTHSLRQDLALEGYKDIQVCQINPGVIDTPAFQHAGNYSGLPIQIRIPMTTPEHVATAIVRLVGHPKREAFVGPFSALGSFAYTLLPALTGAIMVWGMKRYYFSHEQDKPLTSGNLHRPIQDRSAKQGGWKSGSQTEASN